MKQIEQIIETPNECHLTQVEVEELTSLETTIAGGLKVFCEVGEALFTIRDKQLYRSAYGTFDGYCRDRWQMSKTQANRLIGAADVARDLTPIGVILPSSESVARPLVSLPTEQRQDVWHAVVESTPDRKPTSADVTKAVKKIVPVEAIPSEVLGNDQGIEPSSL